MSLQNDRDTQNQLSSESLSNAPVEQLLRNLIDRVDADGIKSDSVLHVLNQVQANTLPIAIFSQVAAVLGSGAQASTQLIECPPDKRIAIFSVLFSATANNDLTITDSVGNNLLGRTETVTHSTEFRNYCPAPLLPQGESLFYTVAGAGDWSVEIHYAVV